MFTGINILIFFLNFVLIFLFITQNEITEQNSIQNQRPIVTIKKIQIFTSICIVIELFLLFLKLKF